jgi:hypothetical protein
VAFVRSGRVYSQGFGLTPGILRRATFDNDSASDGDTNGKISFTSFIEDDGESWSRGWETNDIGERGKNLFWDYVCNDRKAGAYTPDLKYRTPKKDGDFEYIETRYGAALTKYTGTATAVRLPEKVNGIAVKYLYTGVFDRKAVERVLIPNGVTSIGKDVFSRKSLTDVAIPDSVTYIGDSAFSAEFGRVGNLTSVTIGKNVVVIGARAFYSQKLTSVVIPDSATSIEENTFGNNGLTSVTIGSGVTSIGDRAFQTNSLTSVVIPDSVTSIRENAFRSNSLTSVVIPDSVTSIGDSVFSGNNLTSLTIGKGITSINNGMFSSENGYGALTSVVIPDSVTSIGAWAFSENKLTSVSIPDSVTSIGERAFYNNNSLTSITIGSNVAVDSYAIPCDAVYNSNGKKAGVYTQGGVHREWTYTER